LEQEWDDEKYRCWGLKGQKRKAKGRKYREIFLITLVVLVWWYMVGVGRGEIKRGGDLEKKRKYNSFYI